MLISFPYGDMFSPAELPDRNLISIYSKNDTEPIEYEDIRDAVCEALDSPVGTGRLETLAKGKKNVCVAVDDNRETPVRIIAPLIASRLEQAGVKSVVFLVASSRILTDEEKQKRFGKKLCSKYEIIVNTPRDPLSLRDLGYSENGTRIYINNVATEADLLIAVGQIAPSHISGFTGGAETILPGIAGEETVSRLYWESGVVSDDEILGLTDNPVRSEMELAAKRAGLAFVVDAVIDTKGCPVGFVAGDPAKAFRKGADIARKAFGAYFHERADIVVCSSFPFDRDLWQASKALFAAGLMVKEGGVIIFVSPCLKGVAKNHPQVAEFGYHTSQETVAALNNGAITDLSAFSHLLHVGRIIKEKASCIMVKNGLGRDTALALGFKYSATPQRAVDRAMKLMGPGARIAVLEEGGKALPIYMQISRF